jgi:hypothetical protein
MMAQWSGWGDTCADERTGPQWTVPQSIIGRSHRELDLFIGRIDKTGTIQNVTDFCKSDGGVFVQICVSP